jgi:citrate lyase beta subunit
MTRLWRSLLFVPATRPDRFEKAAVAAPDTVCIDLEDAVGPDDKSSARTAALEFLSGARAEGVRWALRINNPRTINGLRDVLALIDSTATPDVVLVPKVESAHELRWLDGLMAAAGRATGLVPVVESTRGLECAPDMARATTRVEAIGFGSADYSAEIGSDMGAAALTYARGRIAAAAGGARIAAIDTVWLDFRDDDGLRAETELARGMGFDGKLAIHPSQVATINAVFVPSARAVERAEKIVAAAEAAGGGVVSVDGEMIDEPVVIAARRTLAAAQRA